MTSALAVLGVTRPNFLLLPPICVALGITTGLLDGGTLDWLNLLPVTIGALLAHAAVNAFNEYADFQSGLDFNTHKTPFSGGSGTLIQNPELAPKALQIALLASGVVIICGLWLAYRVGPQVMPFGVGGLLLVGLYSGPVSRHRWAVLVAPGLGFGALMVAGSALAITGTASAATSLAAACVFFLVNNLLLLNQFPDRLPDAAVGRQNWVISSPRAAAMIYALFAGAAYLAIIVAVTIEVMSPWALIALLTLPLSVGAVRAAFRFDQDQSMALSALAHNVLVTLLTPSLLTIGVLLPRVL